jgi:hypothetical protein
LSDFSATLVNEPAEGLPQSYQSKGILTDFKPYHDGLWLAVDGKYNDSFLSVFKEIHTLERLRRQSLEH